MVTSKTVRKVSQNHTEGLPLRGLQFYRPFAEIVEELNALEEEAKTTDAALKENLKRIGV